MTNAKTLESLMKLELPFIVRTPQSSLVNAPSWWSKKLDEKWVIELYDNKGKNMWLGSGLTFSLAHIDLLEAIEGRGTARSVELPIS